MLNHFNGMQSKFEFQLRLQEFIELVRADNHLQAITYARKYLAPWGATHMKELQRVMATLAFKSSTECPKYKVSLILYLSSFVFDYMVGNPLVPHVQERSNCLLSAKHVHMNLVPKTLKTLYCLMYLNS